MTIKTAPAPRRAAPKATAPGRPYPLGASYDGSAPEKGYRLEGRSLAVFRLAAETPA